MTAKLPQLMSFDFGFGFRVELDSMRDLSASSSHLCVERLGIGINPFRRIPNLTPRRRLPSFSLPLSSSTRTTTMSGGTITFANKTNLAVTATVQRETDHNTPSRLPHPTS